MSNTNLNRKLASLRAQLKMMDHRIEALIKASEPKDQPKGAKPKGKSGAREGTIGKVINYGGGRAKVLERKGAGFQLKALNKLEPRGGKTIAKGKTFSASAPFVYTYVRKYSA
jgi:hypothetical protein